MKHQIALGAWGALLLASSIGSAQPANPTDVATVSDESKALADVTPPDEATSSDDAQPKPSPVVKRGGLVFRDAGFDGLDFNPSGQYLVRYRHHEGHDFARGGISDTARHRARLGFAATYLGKVGGVMQVQDVRVFGAERSTLTDFSADGFDLHQGYLRVMPFEGFEVRVGRQEIAFENHRLIGTVGWIEQARSFDAARVMFKSGMLKVDSFYSKVAEAAASPLDAMGDPVFIEDRDVFGLNLHLAPAQEIEIGSILVGDFGGGNGTRRMTVGALVSGKTTFGLAYGVEGYYQRGTADADVVYRAFMAGGYVGYTAAAGVKPFVKVFADALSGDAAPTNSSQRTFNTLFHTGHKFYGEMDFFLNLPLHTGQRGLADVGGSVGLSPMKGMKAMATFHHFRSTADQGDDLRTFGNEVDLKLVYAPWPLFKLDLLYGLFSPGDIFQAGESNTQVEHFVYSTADFGF